MDHNGWVRAFLDLLAAWRGAAAHHLRRRVHPSAAVGAALVLVCGLLVAAFGAIDDGGRDLVPAGAARGPEPSPRADAPATTGVAEARAEPAPVGGAAGGAAPAATATTGPAGDTAAAPPPSSPAGGRIPPTTAAPTTVPPPATGPAPEEGAPPEPAPEPTDPPASTTTAPPAPDLLAPLRPLLELLGLG